MGLFKAIGKAATNVGKAVKKAGGDAWSEVKRHPGTYGALAGVATAGLVNPGLLSTLGGLAKTGAGKLATSGLGKAATGAFKKPDGGFNWGQLGKVATAGMAFKGQRDDAKRAERYMQGEQARRDMFTNMALKQQEANAPFRQAALDALGNIGKRGTAREYLNG